VDGKSARGSRTADSPAAHLLAAMTGAGQMATQLRVPDKTTEISCFAALLAPYDLTGVTVTADALHTQRAHAHLLVEQKNVRYAFTVKKNQPILYAQLKTLPWDKALAKFYDRSHGHGRLETRVVQVPDRYRPRHRIPARRAGREDRQSPDLCEDRQTHPRDGPRAHRPHQPPGIPRASREDRALAVDPGPPLT